jgi:hypothetical protein
MPMNAKMMFAIAHHGTIKGDPIYDIWAQSKVRQPMPKPDTTPNS